MIRVPIPLMLIARPVDGFLNYKLTTIE